MLTKNDLSAINKIVQDVVTKAVAPLDTKITKLDVKLTGQLSQLNTKITKDVDKLEKAITKEHKIGGEILQVAQVENRETVLRVERIEHHLGFAQI